MRQSIKAITNSITFKLITGIYAVVIPLILLLIYNNNQSRITLSAQMEDVHKNMLQSYIQVLDNQLRSTRTYTVNLALYENDPLLATSGKDEASIQYAKVRLMRDMDERALISNLIDGYFALLQTPIGESFLISTSSTSYAADRNIIREYVRESVERVKEGLYPDDFMWRVCNLDGTDYLIHMISNGEEICIGAYVNLSRLPMHLAGNDFNSQLLCTSLDELPALQQKKPSGMLLVLQSSAESPAVLVEYMDVAEILNSLPFMQKYTYFVSASLILLIPLMFLLIRLIVTKPLNYLTKAMLRIQNGDLDHRLHQSRASGEILIVNESFNQMINEIQHLKIDVYEEALKAQRSQLRNLQLQIRPHFLINSLNMVYNAIENKSPELAKKLILHSVDYFRYMVKVDDDFVPLNEELDHVKTYLEIQAMRYPNMFTYSVNTDRLIEDALITPLLVQTFVENSIKYAMPMTHAVRIGITAESFEVDFAPYVRLKIFDTGGGYPDNVLEILQKDGIIADADGEHIGIRNAMRRTNLLFNGKSVWRFYNDNGAVSEVTLPALFADKADDSEA